MKDGFRKIEMTTPMKLTIGKKANKDYPTHTSLSLFSEQKSIVNFDYLL